MNTVTGPTFDFLVPAQRGAAVEAYTQVARSLSSWSVLPKRVWFDVMDTMCTRTHGMEILFGRTVGMLKAVQDAQIEVGLFSDMVEAKVRGFLQRNPMIDQMIFGSDSFSAGIRSAEYLIKCGKSLGQPETGVTHELRGGRAHFSIGFGRRAVLVRVPKLVEHGEMLIDDHNYADMYRIVYRTGERIVEGWENTMLASALRMSEGGFLHFYPRAGRNAGLRESELARLGGIRDHIAAQLSHNDSQSQLYEAPITPA